MSGRGALSEDLCRTGGGRVSGGTPWRGRRGGWRNRRLRGGDRALRGRGRVERAEEAAWLSVCARGGGVLWSACVHGRRRRRMCYDL